MSGRIRVRWFGKKVSAEAKAAAMQGVNKTMAQAVEHAKENHPWNNVTGVLEGSIQMRPATLQGNVITGMWGSFDVGYALWLEIGTTKMPPYPFLRPAADATYSNLSDNIRKAWAVL